jgi:hypothetical protein
MEDVKPVGHVERTGPDGSQRHGERLGRAGTAARNRRHPRLAPEDDDHRQPGGQEQQQARNETQSPPGEEIPKGDSSETGVLRDQQRRDEESTQPEEEEHGGLAQRVTCHEPGVGREHHRPR